jgi:hypothetical protein
MFVADCNRRPRSGGVKRVIGKLLVEQVQALLTFLRPQSLKDMHRTIPTDLAISIYLASDSVKEFVLLP